MNILVRPSTANKNHPWEVYLDKQSVRFRSELEARSFVATLEARLNAPHRLPELQQRAAG